MKLKADSKHKLLDATGVHKLSREQKLAIRAKKGVVSPQDAMALVTGAGLNTQQLARLLTEQTK